MKKTIGLILLGIGIAALALGAWILIGYRFDCSSPVFIGGVIASLGGLVLLIVGLILNK